MDNTKLFLKNFSLSIHWILKRAGYTKKLNGDYIREQPNGRFHAKIIDPQKKVVELHYDVYIENRHVVFKLPITLSRERGRILKISKPFKKWEMEKDQLQRLLSEYR